MTEDTFIKANIQESTVPHAKSFWTDSQLVDGKCPECGRDVVESKEEAYFLKCRLLPKE